MVRSHDNDRRSSHGLSLRDPFSLSAWKSVHPPGVAICTDARSVRTPLAGFHSPGCPLVLGILSLVERRLYLLRFKRRNPMPALAPKSAVRDQTVAPDVATEVPPWIARASRTQPTSKLPERRRRTLSRQPFWLLPVGLGMILMLGIVIVGSVVLGWAQTVSDDLHYGRPRTFQMDAFVGHETGSTPSHFIALNLQGQIEIIELPGGDATHARMYVGPHIYGPGADLVPVTVRFVEGVQPHHPDMLILFQNTQVVFHNAGGTFAPAPHT